MAKQNFQLVAESGGTLPRPLAAHPIARPLLLGLPLLIATASCVHGGATTASGAGTPGMTAAHSSPAQAFTLDSSELRPFSPEQAAVANEALPVSGLRDSGAAPLVLAGGSPIDRMRSLDCLAQAIYYEARSESDDGQRAVAQVVLNRMRYPGYPATVCGVVYQGPMKAGGGCQFTFTCDGSMTIAPRGDGWARARILAAEALAGKVYAPVGHATHYHTNAVFPLWAPKLVKAAVIGSHIFYRLPGGGGRAAAFTQAYAGGEPLSVPSSSLVRASAKLSYASAALPVAGVQGGPASDPVLAPEPSPVLLSDRLPASRIRAEYQNSGRIKLPGEKSSKLGYASLE